MFICSQEDLPVLVNVTCGLGLPNQPILKSQSNMILKGVKERLLVH